jgi:hypothetical protein
MKLPEIDWEKISSITARAEEVHARGEMTREIWLELARDFADTAHGQLGMPAALGMSCREDWARELEKEPSKRVA